MTGTGLTSAGHAVADAPWLDVHFRSARPEYEESLRQVGISPGSTVLDAGCGGGNFVPLLCELVGPRGTVVALDLAPENVAHVEALPRDGVCPANVRTHVGDILSLPFDDATFDCIWCANVVQYLTVAEFERAVAEFRRVLKPGGKLAIKEFDASLLQFRPMDLDVVGRFMAARRARFAAAGALGTSCGTSIPSRLRRAGLTAIARRGWLVERWAPLEVHTRHFVADLLTYFADVATQHAVPPADVQVWRDVAANPGSLLDDPDFCLREFFVVTVGHVAG